MNIENFTRTETRTEKIFSVLSKRTPSLTVVMENINDIHNYFAVLRSCDAVGVMEAHLVYYGKQGLPRPKKSRFSSGSASKWVKTIQHTSVQTCFDTLRAEGKKIYTTHIKKNAVSLYDLDLTQPVAFVFGNEHAGISEEAYSMADENFYIPQVGMVESLNISVACAVSLFEAFRQRLALGIYDSPQYDAVTLENLTKEWLSL
jgi:tRNA (guanosine-2'-O-)-methyltransferase